MRSTPLRRNDQTRFVFGAVSGVMSPPTATRLRGPSVLSTLRSTLRGTAVTRLRAVGWEEAVCAHTLRRSVRTVEVLTAQGPMPAQLRSPSTQLGVGVTAPTTEGAEERGPWCCGPGRRGGGRAGGRRRCRAGGGGHGGVGLGFLRMFLSSFSLSSVLSVFFLFLLCQAEWREGDLGDTPTMTAQAGLHYGLRDW